MSYLVILPTKQLNSVSLIICDEKDAGDKALPDYSNVVGCYDTRYEAELIAEGQIALFKSVGLI